MIKLWFVCVCRKQVMVSALLLLLMVFFCWIIDKSFVEQTFTKIIIQRSLTQIQSNSSSILSILIKKILNPNKRDLELLFASKRHIIMNSGLLDYNLVLQMKFARLVKLKVDDMNAELISLTQHMIDRPSGHMTKYSRPIVKTPQVDLIDSLLNIEVSVAY